MSRKLTLEIFEAVSTAASTTENSAQLISVFQFQIISTFMQAFTTNNLPPKEPSRVSLDDVIPPKM